MSCPVNFSTVKKGIENKAAQMLTQSGQFERVDQTSVRVKATTSDYNNLISNVNDAFKEEIIKKHGEFEYKIQPSDNLINTYLEAAPVQDIMYQLSPNSVDFTLKSINILESEKAKQIFEKGKKANWDLNKILSELQIPKEQKEIILNLGIADREQIALELASNYSYTVEINTAKNIRVTPKKDIEFTEDDYENLQRLDADQLGLPYDTEDLGNSQYYSNLTVPGGTNYTENEIATPAITPSIKGHAAFSSDSGIGWFRSDEKQNYTEQDIDFLIDNMIKSGILQKNCS